MFHNSQYFLGRIAACWVIGLIFFATTRLEGHFVWVYNDDGQICVVFGEDLTPAEAQFLPGLEKMKACTLIDGSYVPLALKKQTEDDTAWYQCSTDHAGPVVNLSCEYGIFGRGEKFMFLDYNAKYVNLSQKQVVPVDSQMALDVIPSVQNGQLSLRAFFKGFPLQGVEFHVQREASETESVSGEDGAISLSAGGRYIVRAKHVVEESGEFDGKSFQEKRYYCTLVLDVAESSDVADSRESSEEHVAQADRQLKVTRVKTELDELPLGMTSFGATILDGYIYVVGGKEGKAHSYAKSYQNRSVFRLKFDQDSHPAEWQTVGEGLGLQGLAIVGHQGRIYRVGGLEARNAEGEEQDLHSLADVLEFDPDNGSWRGLPSLPQPRSSFDACLVDQTLFVLGGWTMKGSESPQWCTDGCSLDLSDPNAKWQEIEMPFRTRALAVREYQGKLFAIGGIRERGGTTSDVHLYDLKTKKWTQGPGIPTEGRMKAFGCSAAVVADQLLVSTYDGGIYGLSQNGESWVKVHQLEDGRFFHQMLPLSANRFALVGGAHMEVGKFHEVEVFQVSRKVSAETALDNTENR